MGQLRTAAAVFNAWAVPCPRVLGETISSLQLSRFLFLAFVAIAPGSSGQ